MYVTSDDSEVSIFPRDETRNVGAAFIIEMIVETIYHVCIGSVLGDRHAVMSSLFIDPFFDLYVFNIVCQ